MIIKLAAVALTVACAVHGGEIGHFAPGVANIRDYTVPEPGFYGLLYNYYYTTDRLNDRNGDRISSVTINPGGEPGTTIKIKPDFDIYVVSPMFIWVSDWKIAGAKYAAYIAPSFGNSSVSASLSSETGRGINSDASQFGMGDLFVQPVWLGWGLTNWDFALGYGFYAPIGKYDTETVTLPVVGPVKVESADNIGCGFWTQQIQGAASWYPWADRRMAVTTALTYEYNGKKEDFDLTPGQYLTLNWGISQFLPLKKDQTLLLEVGPAGYDTWQITGDTGGAAGNSPAKDQVHAVGGQIGLTHVLWNATLNFHYFYEFAAQDRFQGQSTGLNFAIKF